MTHTACDAELTVALPTHAAVFDALGRRAR